MKGLLMSLPVMLGTKSFLCLSATVFKIAYRSGPHYDLLPAHGEPYVRTTLCGNSIKPDKRDTETTYRTESALECLGRHLEASPLITLF